MPARATAVNLCPLPHAMRPAIIPTYPLATFTAHDGHPAAVFFLGPRSKRPTLRIDQPYRSNYYKIGLILRGSARLKVNLETYDLAPGSLLVLSPEVIKQWLFMSADHESLSIFFTKDFITATGSLNLAKFRFFDADAQPVLALSPAQAATLAALLRTIEQKYDAPHAYREEILRSLIHILLHETAAIYSLPQATATLPSRSHLIAAEFKKLVNQHHTAERSLAFYADQLFITPKHLAQTVREATGKRAAEWIAEAVILEAKVLLQNPALTLTQIADSIRFADPSTFSRFFRKSTGISPAAYRQSCVLGHLTEL